MDYQRACGCRSERSCAQPIYRTIRMNNSHLKSCNGQNGPAAYRSEKDYSMQSGARTASEQPSEHSDCCGNKHQDYPSLAIVTSPSHVWRELFAPCDAMSHGTLFCELYKPWVGCQTGGRMK